MFEIEVLYEVAQGRECSMFGLSLRIISVKRQLISILLEKSLSSSHSLAVFQRIVMAGTIQRRLHLKQGRLGHAIGELLTLQNRNPILLCSVQNVMTANAVRNYLFTHVLDGVFLTAWTDIVSVKAITEVLAHILLVENFSLFLFRPVINTLQCHLLQS